MSTKLHSKRILYTTWCILSLFFAYQYFMRVGPSILMNELRTTFNLSAVQFALIPAAFAYVYGALQIPFGLLLDQFGIKKIAIFSILSCSIGTVLFYSAHSIQVIYFARVLIGAGSASSLIAALKLIGDYMPRRYQGALMGLTLALGTIGALLAGKPQTYLMQQLGWREAGLLTSIGGFLLLSAAIIFIPSQEKEKSKKNSNVPHNPIIHSLKLVIKSRPILLYSLLAFGIYAPFSAISDTWGVSLLMEKYSMIRSTAAESVSYTFVGLCIGSFVIPAFFEHINRAKLGIQMCLFLMGMCITILCYADTLSYFMIDMLFFFFGFFSGAEILCFSAISHVAYEGTRGLSLGYTNTINMIGSALLMHLLGVLLDFFWSGGVSEIGLRIYTSTNYLYAFALIPLVYASAFLLSLILIKMKD
jgi:MFS family permease